MKQRKREVNGYSFYDRSGIEVHLEQMAKKGWMLSKISGLFWTYRAIEPRELHFAVSWYPKASEFDPAPSEDQQTFQDLCAHSGWQLAASSGPMQIFYNDQPDPLPIETDPALELRQIHRQAKKMIVAYGLLLVLAFFMGGNWIYSLLHEPISLLSSASNLFTGLCWLLLGIYELTDVLCYLTWRRRALAAAELGQFLPTPSVRRLAQAVLILVGVGMLYWLLASREPGLRLICVAMVICMALLFVIANGVKAILKRKGFSARTNRTITMTVNLVMAFVLFGGVTFTFIRLATTGRIALWEQREIPLTIEALTGTKEEGYVQEFRPSSTVFVSQSECYEHALRGLGGDPRLPTLRYTIVDVHVSGLYDWCLQELLHEYDDYGTAIEADMADPPYYVYHQTDPAPWGAQEVYQLRAYGHPRDEYLLCWDDRLVKLELEWTPTAEQQRIAGEALGPA